MLKVLIESFKNMSIPVFKIVNYGLEFSFSICLAGILLLLFYNTYPSSYDFFQGGLILFKTVISFVATCLCCGIVFDKLKKEIH